LRDGGQQLPLLDRIVQYVVGDPQTQWLMFLSGQFDRFGGISRDNWDVVVTPDRKLDARFAAKGISLWSEPTIDCFYLGFNMDDPLLGTNKKLRQALSAAFDTPTWIQFFNNRITEANCPVPPGLAGHLQDPAPYQYNLEKAKTLLAEAGYPDGIDPETGKRLALTIDIGSAESSEMIQSTELFIDFIRKIGVEISPQYNHWPAFLERMDRRQVQMYRLAWIADYPDAENFLQLFYGPNQSPGPNHSNYVNPEFDSLYERARVMLDSPERTALYEEMSRIVLEDCPWILTHYRLSYSLNYGWLKNFKHHDFPYLNAKFYRIDPEMRRNKRSGEGA
jgi:ABC-type transport system substrate-binding protein